MVKEREIANVLHDCIIDGMSNLLGENGMKAALFHLQLVQFARNPDEFDKNLRVVFKDGAVVIEKMILKELCKRLNVPYEEKGVFDFERYINKMSEFLGRKGAPSENEVRLTRKRIISFGGEKPEAEPHDLMHTTGRSSLGFDSFASTSQLVAGS